MAEDKIITVTVAGSGRSFEVPVSPGDQPDDVLWEVVENENEYTLRRADGDEIAPDVDVHEEIDEGEVTYAATEPVVGRA